MRRDLPCGCSEGDDNPVLIIAATCEEHMTEYRKLRTGARQ